jgi:hypothetical protein
VIRLLSVLMLLADWLLRGRPTPPTVPGQTVALVADDERVVLCTYERTEDEWDEEPPDSGRPGWRQFRPARLPRLRRRPGTLSTGGPSGRPYPDRHTGVTLPGWRTT